MTLIDRVRGHLRRPDVARINDRAPTVKLTRTYVEARLPLSLTLQCADDRPVIGGYPIDRIDFYPPAAGPEIAVQIGPVDFAADPHAEDAIVANLEGMGMTVLAHRSVRR